MLNWFLLKDVTKNRDEPQHGRCVKEKVNGGTCRVHGLPGESISRNLNVLRIPSKSALWVLRKFLFRGRIGKVTDYRLENSKVSPTSFIKAGYWNRLQSSNLAIVTRSFCVQPPKVRLSRTLATSLNIIQLRTFMTTVEISRML